MIKFVHAGGYLDSSAYKLIEIICEDMKKERVSNFCVNIPYNKGKKDQIIILSQDTGLIYKAITHMINL